MKIITLIFLFFLIGCDSSHNKRDSELIQNKVEKEKQIENQQPTRSDSIDTPSLTPSYRIMESFETWKGEIYVGNDSIFVSELEFKGYQEGKPEANAYAIYDRVLSLFILSQSNKIERLFYRKVLSDEEFQRLNLKVLSITDTLRDISDEIKKQLPENAKVLAVNQDTTIDNKARTVVSWIVYRESIFSGVCGISIFEFNEHWDSVFIKSYEGADWEGTIVRDINQVGEKEILFKYIYPGGSGYTCHLNLIQKQ
ncbi:MAG: hypothetical protein ACE5JB_15650 [bacterium]